MFWLFTFSYSIAANLLQLETTEDTHKKQIEHQEPVAWNMKVNDQKKKKIH